MSVKINILPKWSYDLSTSILKKDRILPVHVGDKVFVEDRSKPHNALIYVVVHRDGSWVFGATAPHLVENHGGKICGP